MSSPYYDCIYIYKFGSDEWIKSPHVILGKVPEGNCCVVGNTIHFFGGSAGTGLDCHLVLTSSSNNDSGERKLRRVGNQTANIRVDFNHARVTDRENHK